LHEVFVTKCQTQWPEVHQQCPVSKSLQIATKPRPFVTDNPAPIFYTACIVNCRKASTVKYATVMTTGLLVNLSIFASDMPSTEGYAALMDNKQHIIKQLAKQVECVRLATDDQSLRACQALLTRVEVTAVDKTAKNAQKLKTDNPKQTDFF
jgi:hypothetical protein